MQIAITSDETVCSMPSRKLSDLKPTVRRCRFNMVNPPLIFEFVDRRLSEKTTAQCRAYLHSSATSCSFARTMRASAGAGFPSSARARFISIVNGSSHDPRIRILHLSCYIPAYAVPKDCPYGSRPSQKFAYYWICRSSANCVLLILLG